MEDGVIDLQQYLASRSGTQRSSFAVWGGEGDRSRLALPLWRAIYLVGGDRGAVLSAPDRPEPPGHLTPLFVLDLASETPRTDFPVARLEGLWKEDLSPPALEDRRPGGVTVFLGSRDGKRWFVVVSDPRSSPGVLRGKNRDDLLFLAGECAGLLFYRGLAD